jgi:hypothetical protein
MALPAVRTLLGGGTPGGSTAANRPLRVALTRALLDGAPDLDIPFQVPDGAAALVTDFARDTARSGGILAPDIVADGISRLHGPVSVEALTEQLAGGQLDPVKLLGETATLLGFNLAKLIDESSLAGPPEILSAVQSGQPPKVTMTWSCAGSLRTRTAAAATRRWPLVMPTRPACRSSWHRVTTSSSSCRPRSARTASTHSPINQMVGKPALGAPPTAAQNAVVRGRHPMLTPPRRLELVHAVRLPLQIPSGVASAERPPGATYARILPTDDPLWHVHTPTTVQVDMQATWKEWADAHAIRGDGAAAVAGGLTRRHQSSRAAAGVRRHETPHRRLHPHGRQPLPRLLRVDGP